MTFRRSEVSWWYRPVCKVLGVSIWSVSYVPARRLYWAFHLNVLASPEGPTGFSHLSLGLPVIQWTPWSELEG